MSYRSVLLIGSLASALSLVGGTNAAAADNTEARVLDAINAERAAVGAGPLLVDPALTGVAEQWATAMAFSGIFVHNPTLRWTAPPGYRAVAENIGWGSNVDSIDANLRNSPAHYQNMVNPRFNRVGVGVAEVNGRVYVVQNFSQS